MLVATLLMTTIYAQYQFGYITTTNEMVFGMIALLIATILNLMISVRERHIITSFVAYWAFHGIRAGSHYSEIIRSSSALGAILMLGVIYVIWTRYRKAPQKH